MALSTTTIALIALGVAIAIALAILVIYLIARGRRRRREQEEEDNQEPDEFQVIQLRRPYVVGYGRDSKRREKLPVPDDRNDTITKRKERLRAADKQEKIRERRLMERVATRGVRTRDTMSFVVV